MSREQYRARSKKVQKLGRDGLVERDKATGEECRVSQRTADVSFATDRAQEQAERYRAAQRGGGPAAPAPKRRKQRRPTPPPEAARPVEYIPPPGTDAVDTPLSVPIAGQDEQTPLPTPAMRSETDVPVAASLTDRLERKHRQHKRAAQLNPDTPQSAGSKDSAGRDRLRFEPERWSVDDAGNQENLPEQDEPTVRGAGDVPVRERTPTAHTEGGSIRYRKEDVASEARTEALDKVIDIAGGTAEYTKQMEAAPILKASGLSEEFKLLADFNGSVLAGQETKYGIQMVTWDWTYNKTGVTHGHYYCPGGADSYTAAKQDFAVRSGLVHDSALFAPEQLTEIYRCIHETLESGYPITEERRKLLEAAAGQIERTVPDLAERVEQSNQKEQELEPPDVSGMSFC